MESLSDISIYISFRNMGANASVPLPSQYVSCCSYVIVALCLHTRLFKCCISYVLEVKSVCVCVVTSV